MSRVAITNQIGYPINRRGGSQFQTGKDIGMKLTFLGAAHEVTGSCTLLEVGGRNILVDCGMEQGADIFQNQELPVDPGKIDFVCLTHAHIDHSGNLPLLYKNGFRGEVFASEATAALCDIMLKDSAGIQEFEAEWRNRKAKRSGSAAYEPIYTTQDALGLLQCMRPCPYDRKFSICEGVEIRFNNAGHLLGASSIEFWLEEQGKHKKIVFSGDLGNIGRPFLRNPARIEQADYVVIESTYGDRLHESQRQDYVSALAEYIQQTFDRGGNVVIPAFAVGRAQELLYFLRQIKQERRVQGHGDFPVYMDSPLAGEATEILLQCDPDVFNDQTRELIAQGINPILFSNLRIAQTAEQSKAINFDNQPKVIISASGMCEAGRIRHHLKHNLWREESLILFAGYQSAGTLGRSLRDGASTVRLFGEEIAVRAQVAALSDTSGHADKQGLLHWLEGFRQKPALVFVNHGEASVCDAFAGELRRQGYAAEAPYSGTCYDLCTGAAVVRTTGIPARKGQTPERERKNQAFDRLVAAARQLVTVAEQCRGMANKEMAKFESQIRQLCDKWRK